MSNPGLDPVSIIRVHRPNLIGRGTVKRLNGPFIARTPHSALWRSLGIALSSNKSIAARYAVSVTVPARGISLTFLERTIFPWRILVRLGKALSPKIARPLGVTASDSFGW